jgi:hypothetical protein
MRRSVGTLILLLLTGTASARIPRNNDLKGLETVSVLVEVEELNKDAKELGLSAKAIQTETEGRLRKAGVRVSSEDINTFLYVNVLVLKVQDGYFAVSTTVALTQPVILERNKMGTLASGWTKNGIHLTGNPGRIREVIGQLTDEFIKAFREANPPAP